MVLSNNYRNKDGFDYDYLIIGSGFGGSVSALRLTEKGYRVAVLEAGKRFGPDDFPRTNWNLRRFIWMPAFRWHGILRIEIFSNLAVLAGAGVGGGSLVYANTLLEPPDAFYRDGQWSGMGDWKATLAPCYRTAKKMLGVTPCPQQTSADEALQDVAEEMGRGDTYRVQEVGVYFGEPEKTVPDPYFDGKGPDRTGCRLCGGCMIGCRHDAKNTLDKNYLYLAEQAGAEVFPETKATMIRTLDEEGDGGDGGGDTRGGVRGYEVQTVRSTARFDFRGRTARRFRARGVVLAAGVLGTVELLLRCKERGTLPRLSPMLGRRVRTNSESLTAAVAGNHEVDYSKGVAITSSIYPDEHTHIEGVRFPAGSDVMYLIGTHLVSGKKPLRRIANWLWYVIRHPWVHLLSLWPLGWATRTIILLTMQTVDNSIRFYRKKRWLPFLRPKLEVRPEPGREPAPVNIEVAHEVSRRLAKRIDGHTRGSVGEMMFNLGSTAHILGGCAIGPDPEHGVIDGQHRVFGYDNILVVDGSAIPANLGVNPSLTITALAEHAMSGVPARDDSRPAKENPQG